MEYSPLHMTREIVSIVSGIFVIVGVLIGVVSLILALKALKETRNATLAQVFFRIQQFGFHVRQTFLSSPEFERYYSNGMQSISQDLEAKVMGNFQTLLSAYNVIWFQRKLGYLQTAEWELYKRELGAIVRSEGARHYFGHNPIEKTLFDEEFKELIAGLQRRGSRHGKTS